VGEEYAWAQREKTASALSCGEVGEAGSFDVYEGVEGICEVGFCNSSKVSGGVDEELMKAAGLVWEIGCVKQAIGVDKNKRCHLEIISSLSPSPCC
jgi:hypothetical protein